MTAQPFDTPAPATFEPLTSDDPREVGGYRLRARLGADGMGRVYLAHTPAGRPVALKVIRPELAEDPEFRHRFTQEVASARRTHGLYTAQVVDAGTDAATPWLATAFVPGPSLHQVVHRHGPLPERTVLLLLAGIAEALQVIHTAGVVHRDLKPANVLIAPDGPRVIDFGIARAADASPLTGTGLRIGSPGFMAPEQALGLPATPATDVFALGALIAYIGSGTTPFGGGPEPVSLYRVVHEEPALCHLPHGLHDLVRYCLAKNPEDRPDTAWLVEAARHHPATGGELRFSDGWLPSQVSSELHHHTGLSTTPAPPGTVLDPARAVADAPTARVLPTPAPTRLAPVSGPRTASTPHRSARIALLTTAALLAGATAAFLVLDNSDYFDDSGDRTPAATNSNAPTAAATPSSPSTQAPVAGYTAAYTDRELVSPDSDYEFDLRAGKVTQDTSSWYLGREAGAFYVPEDSDAYIPPAGPLALPDCLKGIDTQPTTTLPFTTLRADRSFCVRAHGGQDIAIIRTLTAASNDGPVKVAITYYHHSA
ncbi:serine/threonine-protein kinase [Kitasatospora sp. DSM 101779]|uniref:serine/threonine-protein kinase n=1 Tax=Kitasatospora sp. DSM 101779 TaxID=2853165 RepID=UPI0021DB3DCA|nr:serine/threonine-protein kinase [Kitasatospora sp. DSM 101779]MCU7820104.1 serine/threonine protein kinase [Kitasatospora sp. DSM 101779]